MKAVDCPQLSQLTDVIVFSTKGPRSILSMLSGGDYDGDLVFGFEDFSESRSGHVGMNGS